MHVGGRTDMVPRRLRSGSMEQEFGSRGPAKVRAAMRPPSARSIVPPKDAPDPPLEESRRAGERTVSAEQLAHDGRHASDATVKPRSIHATRIVVYA